MPIDASRATDFLAAEVARVPQPPSGWWPFGVPRRDLLRSPAAFRVGHLAAEAGLGLFHTEWRHTFDLPAHWVPAHDTSLAERPVWHGGVLPEAKYQSFRHDQAIGGFHPGMRAKWSAHELCHGLVGFAWKPGASPLFVATASRLAEVLPVLLWYWLDEAHAARCPLHAARGAVHRGLCPACERVAEARVDDARSEGILEEGRQFLEGELAAIWRTRREGRPVPNLVGAIDLCSDGIAYAAAHLPRLRSEAFERYHAGFLRPDGGCSPDLEALEGRVLEVARGILEGEAVAPLAPSRDHGEVRWILQDLGWRLLTLAEETDGEARQSLLDMADTLSGIVVRSFSAVDLPNRLKVDATLAVENTLRAYRSLYDDYDVPSPEAVFALGFGVLGVGSGRSVTQVTEGLMSALPRVSALYGAGFTEVVARFLQQDAPVRLPLGRRFATWLGGEAGPALSDLCRFEAELAALPFNENEVVGLGEDPEGTGLRLSEGARVVFSEVDLPALTKSVDFGDYVLRGSELVDVDGAEAAVAPGAVVLVRGPEGDPNVVQVPLHDAEALLDLDRGAVLSEGVRTKLLALGALAPERWSM
jgi:hypothetical protein